MGRQKGSKHTEETRRKIGLANSKALHYSGEKSPNWKGGLVAKKKANVAKRGSLEYKIKLGNLKKGKLNPAWSGGKSYEMYTEEWTETLKESIRQRDNYTCQICGIHQDELNGIIQKLDVHHIDYDKYNLNPDNLLILCRSCHMKTNKNRDYWIKYFYANTNNNI